MNAIISKAVNERRLLFFSYKGKPRIVEPHTYGRQTSGTDAVCAWQEMGGSGVGYRLVLEVDMRAIDVGEPQTFLARPDYQRGDRRFAVIYAEL